MKFENTKVYNFENAFRGMRNPKNSWEKSDSDFSLSNVIDYQGDKFVADKWVAATHPELNWPEQFSDEGCRLAEKYADQLWDNGILQIDKKSNIASFAAIGPNDMKLAQTLIKGGSEHRKFLRQIFVSVDITAPLYWWKQMDTYKVATAANSTSTMHKLTSKPITLDCFETDDMNSSLVYYTVPEYAGGLAGNDIGMLADFMIEQLEFLRQKYLETKDKRYWKELVRWLPESWLQTRTWTANYEILHTIANQRKNHKLNEWSGLDDPSKDNFMNWMRQLPYAQYLIFYDGDVSFQIEK